MQIQNSNFNDTFAVMPQSTCIKQKISNASEKTKQVAHRSFNTIFPKASVQRFLFKRCVIVLSVCFSIGLSAYMIKQIGHATMVTLSPEQEYIGKGNQTHISGHSPYGQKHTVDENFGDVLVGMAVALVSAFATVLLYDCFWCCKDDYETYHQEAKKEVDLEKNMQEVAFNKKN